MLLSDNEMHIKMTASELKLTQIGELTLTQITSPPRFNSQMNMNVIQTISLY